MEGRTFGYALAIVLLVAGATVFAVGAATYAAESAQERTCRATYDGLDELQCMNFGGIAFAIGSAWAAGLAGVGLLAAGLTWLIGRRGPTREGSA